MAKGQNPTGASEDPGWGFINFSLVTQFPRSTGVDEEGQHVLVIVGTGPERRNLPVFFVYFYTFL